MAHRERTTEMLDCRECGTTFNLTAQWYYDNLCPSCKAEQDGEDVTLPSCPRCGDRIRDDEGTHVQTYTRGYGRETLYVHEDECADAFEGRGRP